MRALVACALAAACARESSPVLASGQGVSISAAELRASVNEESAADRAAYSAIEKKHRALEKLIDFEVLVAEARRQGLDRDPEILRATKDLMVQRLLRDRQDQNQGARILSEDERRARFEADKGSHAVPETVRLTHLFLKAPEPNDRAQRSAEAQALRSQALAFPMGEQGNSAFAELARIHSDEAATAVTGGDLTHRTHEQLEYFYSKAAADGAFALTEEGQLSQVLESPRGLHLFRLLARTASRIPTFEEYRASQSAPVSRADREEEVRLYTKSLRAKAGVVVHEEELKKFEPVGVPEAP